MLKGFMDESGIAPHDEVCVIAGFMGDSSNCDVATEEWKKRVQPLGEFHSRRFFARNSDGSMAGRYKHLDVATAEEHATSLVDLLADSGLEPIGIAFASQAFRSLHEDERRWMTSAVTYDRTWPMQGAPNHPWFACFHYCVTQANNYTPEGEKISLTFDRQDTYEGNAVKIYGELKKLGGKWGERLADALLFSTRAECVLLQAADLLAYVIPQLIDAGNIDHVRNPVIAHALSRLAIEKEYVRAMDARVIDEHLRKCPFRSTFWQGLSEPDFFEELRSQGINVLACKDGDGIYRTHHIKRDKVKVIDEFDLQRLGARKRIDGRDESTTKTRQSGANSTDALHESHDTTNRQSSDKPR